MTFHLRPLSGLVLLGLACCASLHAGITLTLAPAGARPECRPGAFLDLAVALTGREAGQEVVWSVWAFNIGRYQATLPTPPVTALGEGRFRFAAPAGPETCTYLIQARCGERASAPLALHVEEPVSGSVASSPAGIPTPPATPVPAAASPAVADAGAFPFSKLPLDLQSQVVSFAPRTFAPASRHLRAHALRELRHLDATHHLLSDLELVSRVLTHPRATSIRFGYNVSLSQACVK